MLKLKSACVYAYIWDTFFKCVKKEQAERGKNEKKEGHLKTIFKEAESSQGLNAKGHNKLLLAFCAWSVIIVCQASFLLLPE